MEAKPLIQNKARIQQINSFENMRFGTITPTDIDGLIEYKNKLMIFIELKHSHKELPGGQRLALERLINDIKCKPAIALIGEHFVEDPAEIVDVSECKLRSYYYNLVKPMHWINASKEITIKDCVLTMIDMIDRKGG